MTTFQSGLGNFVGNGSSPGSETGTSGASSALWSPQGLAANNQNYGVGGTNPFVNAANYMQSGLLGAMGQANHYGAGLENQREGLMNQILGQLSPGGIRAAATTNRNSIMQNAAQAGNQAAMSLNGMGYGSGASGGVLGSMLGQGMNQANASDTQFNNPLYVSSVLGQGLGAVQQGMQNPLAQEAAGYEPYIMGQNQTNYAQRGQGLLGQLAPMMGSFFGGQGSSALMNGLFGGGGPGYGGSAGYGGFQTLNPMVGTMPGVFGASFPMGG